MLEAQNAPGISESLLLGRGVDLGQEAKPEPSEGEPANALGLREILPLKLFAKATHGSQEAVANICLRRSTTSLQSHAVQWLSRYETRNDPTILRSCRSWGLIFLKSPRPSIVSETTTPAFQMTACVAYNSKCRTYHNPSIAASSQSKVLADMQQR